MPLFSFATDSRSSDVRGVVNVNVRTRLVARTSTLSPSNTIGSAVRGREL
jgi:hypothetical protein